MIELLIAWAVCVVFAGIMGGVTLLLSLLQVPLWLGIIVWGAAVPIYSLSLVIYLGGLYYGFGSIFGKKKDPEDDGSAQSD